MKTWKLFTGPTFYNLPEDAPPDPSFETINLETSSCIPIHCWYSRKDTEKRCVVLFHAIATNKGFLNRQALAFRNLGYNVLLIDFRGHGLSGATNSSFGYKESDEVLQAVVYARQRNNDHVVLYGFSMGAIAVMKAISENKVQPDAVILEGPFDNFHQLIRSRATALGFPGEPFGLLVTFWIGIEQGYNAFRHNGSNYAKSIKCPVLLGWGEYDRYINRKAILNIYDHLSSQSKKLVIYPDADHEDYLKTDPIIWQREISSFLQETAAHYK